MKFRLKTIGTNCNYSSAVRFEVYEAGDKRKLASYYGKRTRTEVVKNVFVDSPRPSLLFSENERKNNSVIQIPSKLSSKYNIYIYKTIGIELYPISIALLVPTISFPIYMGIQIAVV